MSTMQRRLRAPRYYEVVDIDRLKPHPHNATIYGAEKLNEEFIESIRKNGVQESLAVNNEYEIPSGHRRWLGAKAAGLTEIRVVRHEPWGKNTEEE